jgi:hypothetical protein
MTEDFIKDGYNKYTDLPMLSYNCVAYLIDHNELIWKLLKYNDANAWKVDGDHPNLTKTEKGAIIYGGQENETDFRVFFDVGADNSWETQACILRVTPIELQPTNYVIGKVTMSFEIYCHYKINSLSNYTTRLNTISQQIIEIFNGQEIGGVGKLFFDSRASSRAKMQIMGSIPWKGNVIFMTNWI